MLKTEGYENSQLFMALTPKNGVKASKLYSYKPIDGTGDFHWSRNHTAYRLNQEGVLELMGNNLPRVDYSNTCPELLIEKESENLTLRSQEFDNAIWTKSEATIIANNTISPDSTTTADKLVESTNNAQHAIYQSQNFTNGVTYTYSFFVKPNGRTKIRLTTAATNVCPRADFDLVSKTATPFSPSFNANIEEFENGWFRCSVSRVAPSTTFDLPYILMVQTFGVDSYLGDGVSGLYLWGAQLEESDYATSYIPTTNATQTRPKDVCYNTANGYNDADWSVVMRVRLNNIGSSADEPLLALSDGTTDYYFAIYTDSNPKLHFTWYNNPDQDTYSTNDLSNGIVNVGVSFDSVTAEYIIVIDGTLFDSGTLVNNAPGLFGNFNRLDLGSIAGTGSPDKDGIIGIQYYDSALSQSSLENLTA